MLYAHIYTFFASILFLGIFLADFIEQFGYLIKDIKVIHNSNNYEIDINSLKRRKRDLWSTRLFPMILELLTMVYLFIVLIDSINIVAQHFSPLRHITKFLWS